MANYGNRERLTNGATSNLVAAMNDSQTSLQVDDGSSFPTNGNFRVRIDDEIIHVIGNAFDVMVVERGVEGTTPAAHADNSVVSLVYTEDGLERYFRDDNAYANTSRPPLGRIVDSSGNVLTGSSFGWTNQGTCSTTDQNGTILVTCPGSVSSQHRTSLLTRTPPASPWKVNAAINFIQPGAATYNFGGIYMKRTFNSRTLMFGIYNESQLAIHNTTATSGFASSFHLDVPLLLHDGLLWLQMEDDGANLHFRVSHDGVNWITVNSQTHANYLQAAPNEIGIFVDVWGASLGNLLSVVHWDEGAT